MKRIQLVTTGGTIDSYYHIDDCTVYPLESSALPKFLEKYVNMNEENLLHTQICSKDSREINSVDLVNVSDVIKNSPLNCHVVTHGTFTLFENARKVEKLLNSNSENVVVFTGAMWPLTGFATNDSAFNLGSAITACKLLRPGVYVSFYGEIYNVNDLDSLHG